MTPEQVQREAERLVGRGLYAAGLFYMGRVKELLSVPAPRRLVKSRSGVSYYVATTPATPGAPPRKLSGRLRASGSVRKLSDVWVQCGMGGVKYARRLELEMNHRFLSVALRQNAYAMGRIVGNTLETSGTLG